MEEYKVIRTILHSQSIENVDAFIQWLDSFLQEVSDSDISIPYRPFNKNTDEYVQVDAVRKAALALANALIKADEKASQRLAYYLQTTDISNEKQQALRIYLATNFALEHQRKISTGGGTSLLSEIDKKKLRYVQMLFKRFFPNLSTSFNSENNLINKIACSILARPSLSNRTDQAIKLKTLSK